MTDSDPAIPEEVRRLAEASEEILRWIVRLSDHTPEARPEVVERIRRDYELRLRSSDTRLAAQRPLLIEIVSERKVVLAALRDDLAGQAADLEELELRRDVGEFDGAELRARRAPVERNMSDLGARIEREKEMIEMFSGALERTAPSAAEPAAAAPSDSVAPVVAGEEADAAEEEPPVVREEPPATEPELPTDEDEAPAVDDAVAAPDPDAVLEGDPAPRIEPAMDIVPEPVPQEEDVPAVPAAAAAAEPDDAEADTVSEDVGTEDAGTEDAETEGAGGGFADEGFADELEFLESLSLGETGPFDAVSAMLDEEEKAGDTPA